MGYIKEKIEAHVTDPAGKCGASQGTKDLHHPLSACKKLHLEAQQKKKKMICHYGTLIESLNSGAAISFRQICKSYERKTGSNVFQYLKPNISE